MAAKFIEADVAALNGARDAAMTYDTALAALLDTLPANFPLGSRRKIAEMRSMVSYTLYQELPSLIGQYTPVTLQETPTA
ncbi:hypothetical protein ASF09_11580 [Sphingomonas sp. Leaf242]|nr:hypothetical protein ASF09_11580 [Sphingomonas sp. Leaf242]